MPDILLLQPPVRDFYLTIKRTIPYGLASIAASLEKCGFSVELFDSLAVSKSKTIDLPDEMSYLKQYYQDPDISPFSLFHKFKHFGYSFEHIGKIVRESGAGLIGISSLFTAYYDEAIKIAEIVKKNNPKSITVLGGHHPTIMPEKVMESSLVDFVIRGEGEVSMPLLAEAVKKGMTHNEEILEKIPGLVFRRQNGDIVSSEPAIMDNLDSFPLPSMNLIKNSYYRRGKKGSAVITASRGCPMDCSYCSVGSSSLKYRRRTVKSVINEIERAVKDFDCGFIDFEDENLSLNGKWFLELLNEIISRFSESKIEFRAMNGLFPPSLNEKIIQNMKKAGFKTLNLSLGSTSKAQQKKFRRPDVLENLDEILLLSGKYYLEAVCYIIVGAPGQLSGDSISDLLYLAGRRALAGVSVFYPAPGSSDYETASGLGLLPDCFSLMRSSAIPVSHTTSRLESVTLSRLGRILNFMKMIVDQDGILPDPEIPPLFINSDFSDRYQVGKKLISGFLYDGVIRGVGSGGQVFTHRSSLELNQLFIDGLKNTGVAGVVTDKHQTFN
ncbi:MAG: B12-binding domain-containing radical SAM protein [Desulfobacterales bacterium]|jgi:anaerobic magnesium-protoporphyrin IX monomethyl ester cyclase|nr:B12-binding domain-containing radical SAM protein [Desulfobacteraceae bacterium]MBT7086332.1 B12-binding domain-containing radical SAM protein [Desulfobacterales bacterium]MBT7696630.1 B12-binding domain-containing radical SAM protein [Desulfobacterales bacterium]